MLSVILLSLASAQPEVGTTPEGTVQGRVVVAATVDEVREAMSTGMRRAEIASNGAEVSATTEGKCELEHIYVPHPLKSVTYTVRTCPTEHGYRSVLVDSNDFDHFEAVWDWQETDGGTQVTFDLDMATSFPLPGFVMRAQTKKGVMDALLGVERAFTP